MADGAAGLFTLLSHSPGNPELPTLPNPSDPKDGFLAGPTTIAGVDGGERDDEVVLAINAAAPGVARGFAQTYLNQVGATPNPLDFGNVTSTRQRTITLHNTYRTSVDVTAVDLSALSGVSLISPGLPVTLEPFSSQVFTIEANVSGDTSFDDLAVFTTSAGTVSVRVLGRRVIIFDLVPQRGVVETITFLTDIIGAEQGTEQAMSTRSTPRSKLVYKTRITDPLERTRKVNKLLGSMHLPMAVQLWHEAKPLTIAALSTDTVLQVNTTGMELVAGDDVSIVLPDDTTIELEIDSLTASSITLSEAVGTDLPFGTQVMPLKIGRMLQRVNTKTYAVNASDIDITFNVIEYENIGNVDPAYFDTHPVDSLPIVTAKPFFDGRTRAGVIISDTEILDDNTGQIDQTRSEVIAELIQDVLVYCDSHAEQHAWRTFLHSLRGSWGLFYIETAENDLPLNSAYSLGTTSFNVPPMGLASFINNVAPRRDIKVTIAGVDYYRRIDSVVDNVTFETVTMSSAIPGAGTVDPADFFCSWLTLSRVLNDVATFTHPYSGTAELRFKARSVIDGV